MARLAAAVEEGTAMTKDERRKTKERRPQTADRGQPTVEQAEAGVEGENGEGEVVEVIEQAETFVR
jgi:hypothetical protein